MQVTDILKINTAQFHEEIEHKLESKRLFDGSFTQANYYKMLLVNHQFIKAYESEIHSLLNENDRILLNQINFNKLALIEKDLVELNLNPYIISPIQKLENRAEALGALYVIEGSMLGGMVIAKQLKKYPELEKTSFNYFGHYGSDIGPIWKKFVSYMNDQLISDQDKTSALNGALKAYSYLIASAN